MGFKDKFISDLPKVFKDDLAKKTAREQTKKIIDDFFINLREELEPTLEVFHKDLEFKGENGSYTIQLKRAGGTKLSVHFHNKMIVISALPYGYGEQDTFSFDEKQLKYIRNTDERPFSGELLESYLKKAFETPLENLLKQTTC